MSGKKFVLNKPAVASEGHQQKGAGMSLEEEILAD